jgi:hypothetical protein
LAGDEDTYNALRLKLFKARYTSPVFDIVGYARAFEQGVINVWDRFLETGKHDHIDTVQYPKKLAGFKTSAADDDDDDDADNDDDDDDDDDNEPARRRSKAKVKAGKGKKKKAKKQKGRAPPKSKSKKTTKKTNKKKKKRSKR